jgi:hypothetical protein
VCTRCPLTCSSRKRKEEYLASSRNPCSHPLVTHREETSSERSKKALANQKPRCALAPARVVPIVNTANVAKKRESVKEKR